MRKMINKSMRRLFAILLSALIMLSAVIPAVAAEDESSAPAGNSQTITEESKDESKTEDLVVEEPKDEEPKDEEPKDEEPKDEEPKDEEPKAEEPKDEEPNDEEVKDEEPKAEEPKDEEPEDEEPKAEEPKAEEPKAEEPKAEEPKDEEPKAEEPKDEEPKDEEPKAEEPKDEEPKAEEPKDEEPKAEEAKVEETKDEEPKAEEPEAEEKAFADLTVEEQYAALQEMSEEEAKAAVSSLSEDQIKALSEYIVSLDTYEIPQTVTSTNAAPFMPPVFVPSSRKIMFRSAKKAGSSDAPDGLEMEKTATPNADGSYTITLEAYTTGVVTTSTQSVPCDIVLVLDQSGSMKYGFDGSEGASYDESRQKGMQEAVGNFIDAVSQKYNAESADHRISIVTFGSEAEKRMGWTSVDAAGKTALKNSISSLPPRPNGATRVDLGMEQAKSLIDTPAYSGSNETRQQVVVVFTDGVPTTYSEFDIDVANNAISNAKELKKNGVTVYSIGIFQSANEAQLNGTRYAYFDWGALGVRYRDCDGSVGSAWRERQGLFSGGDVDLADIPAGNRFLNYLSSDFINATEIGLETDDAEFSFIITFSTYHGFKITRNFDRDYNGYYLTTNNADGLNGIFQSISNQITTATIDLGSQTVVQDVVTPYFTAPDNASDIRVYTATAKADGTFNSRVAATDLNVEVNNSIVTVTNFDFNENCVTDTPKGDGTYGKKLIIEFTVTPDPDFLGGSTSTNGAASGVLDKDNNPVAHFEIPAVQLPVKQIIPEARDRYIYATTEDQLTASLKTDSFTVQNADGSNSHTYSFAELFDGVNNAAVEVRFNIVQNGTVVDNYIIPAGAKNGVWSSGDMPILPQDEYTITFTVVDAADVSNKTTVDAHSSIYVFKPVLTYADKNVYYKGNLTVSTIVPSVEDWKCGTMSHTDSGITMDTTKPTLTYEYTVEDGTVDQMTDYTVGLSKVGVQDHTYDDIEMIGQNLVTLLRDCSTEDLDDEAATAAEAFKIHVYTPEFTFDDDVKYYGEAYSLPTVDSITWKNGNKTAPSPMDNAVPAVTVALTPTPDNAFNGGVVQVTEDVPVKAVITLGGTDVTEALITAGKVTRTCTPEVCETVPAATADTAFVVHVKTVSLTIKKSIEGTYADMTKTYSFNVSYSGNVNYSFAESTFTLGHNGEKKLTGLPVGSVTVEESGVLEGYTVAFDLNGAPGNPKTPSEGKASETLTLTAGKEENTVIVHNTLATVPETGISLNDGMSSALLLMIALGGMAAMAVLSVVKRFSGRVKPVRK